MKLSELYRHLRADHQRAIKEYPLLNSVTFFVITLLLMYLAIMSILRNQPLVAFLSGFFGGLSARDAWVSYEAWRHKS